MDWSDNCFHLHVNHLDWRDGCIIIYFYHSKGYHEGVNRNDPWYIYLNPLYSENFPALALAKYVLKLSYFGKG